MAAGYQLPTMQCNALRILLGKRDFAPDEVALLSYHTLEKAPRIGSKGIENIRCWLRQFDLDIAHLPVEARGASRSHKRIERAIAVLTQNGFTVSPGEAAGAPSPARRRS